jgi:perosamine synthetase
MSTQFDLREPGAPARAGEIALCVPHLGGREWEYVKECLDTNFVSSVGPFVGRFEREIAERVGARHAVATVNGTAALHIALLVAGVEPDDEVLVSTLTFIAPVNAIRYANAWPVFIDAEPEYWQMDPQRVADYLERGCDSKDGVVRSRATGRRVRAILPVDILGHPVDMDPIRALARTYGLAVIEDATESLGATYKGSPVGTRSDVACFSFNGNKLITTGGGGMIVSNDDALARRAKYLTTQAKDDPVEFVHGAIGFNYRLTNLQAAVGCAQIERLAEHIADKRRIAATYREALADVRGLTFMPQAPWARSVFWMYTLLVDEREFGCDSRMLLHALERRGIQARPLWQPAHASPAHRDATRVSCPVADDLNRRSLSLPCSVGLAPEDLERVVAAVHDASRSATTAK